MTRPAGSRRPRRPAAPSCCSAGGGGSPGLRRRVGDLLAAIAAEHRRAEAAAEDRNMVRRLAGIHADTTFHLDRAREDAQYAAAFRSYGIPVDALSPAEAGARIAARPIAVELAGALDHWAFSRRRARPPRIAEAQHLVRVARLADPDPWRNRLRDALDLMTADRARARAELERLAASADAYGLTAASAERLAWALADLGNGEAAVALYRAAQRAHPDDFWINSNLAARWSPPAGTTRPSASPRSRWPSAPAACTPSWRWAGPCTSPAGPTTPRPRSARRSGSAPTTPPPSPRSTPS